MRFLLILSLALFTANAEGQSILKRYFTDAEALGDKLFDEFAYADAVEAYQRAYEDESSDSLVLKIAESYRMLNDPGNASLWYEKVFTDQPTAASEYYLHYAEALASEKRYAEAKNWYDAYGKWRQMTEE